MCFNQTSLNVDGMFFVLWYEGFELKEGKPTVSKIGIAVAGVGNCASSLVQGIRYYRDRNPQDAIGLMHWKIGSTRPET